MKLKNIFLNYKKKKINLEVKDCNELQKGFGLMFSRREKAQTLLFDFKKKTNVALTSYFVFFPFVVIWMNGNKIVDVKTIKPFKFIIRCEKCFDKIVEIPINEKYKDKVKFFV
jgi:uncharacterized membrane protein (UPF0127 family)